MDFRPAVALGPDVAGHAGPARHGTAELPAGARVTGRLRRHVAGRVADGLAVSVAGDGLLSWPISHAAWVQQPTAPWSSRSRWQCWGLMRPAVAGLAGCRTR